MEHEPELENKGQELKRLATKAFGEATAFNMLDPNSKDPKGEIQAAKDTSKMLQETLRQPI